GLLWNKSLVMYDKETGSLWSHILGEAEQGPLKGKKLTQIPSVMTDWQSWSRQHPDGTVVVLSRTTQEYRRQFYRQPGKFVLGIADGAKAMAWNFRDLNRRPVMHVQWQGEPAVIVFDRRSVTARMYSRKLGQRTLTFE